MEDRASAILEGPRSRLRLVEADDYAPLRRLELGSELAFRWRHGGHHIRPEDYGEHLAANSLVLFIFEAHHGAPYSKGLLVAYSPDFRNGTVFLGMARLERSSSSIADALVAAESLTLFIDYLFQGWNLRKICVEVAAYNLPQFASFTALLSAEAHYRDHVFLAGEWWDMYVFTLWRHEWPGIRSRMISHR